MPQNAMTLTVDMLRQWFAQFNAAYFDAVLPMPTLALSKARTRLGTMSCQCKRTLLKRTYYNFIIRVSTYYDCTEREYQTVLLHEMIHYYITFKGIRDTSAHGHEFHRLMNRLNNDYGWNITVTSSVRGKKLNTATRPPQSLLILALTMHTGERYLSVVSPRYATIIDRQAQATTEIAQHRWFMSSDPYFSSFPKVRSLRARRVTKEVYEEKTLSMTPLALKRQ